MKTISYLLIGIFLPTILFCQTWEPLPDFPNNAGGDGSAVFSIEDKIYIAGGFNSKLLYQYDPSTNAWTRKNDIPGIDNSRSFSVGFSHNGYGYVGMGLDINSSSTQFRCKKDLWKYDPSSDSWSEVSPYPGDGCCAFIAFKIKDRIYIGGGEVPHNQSRSDLYSYDPMLDEWEQLADYPDSSGILSPFSFSIGNKGYVSCGNQNGTTINKTYEYDPATNKWMQKSNFPGEVREGGVAFTKGDYAYCGWGYSHPAYYNDFYSYDPFIDQWIKTFNAPSNSRAYGATINLKDTIYLGLGWNNSTLYYDWWKLSSLTTSIKGGNNHLEPLKIYPNPFESFIIFEGVPRENEYVIFDSAGKELEQGIVTGPRISLAHLDPGTYTLIVSSEGERHQFTILKK